MVYMFRTSSNKLFPSLFENNGIENLHCEIFELAKHLDVTFPLKTPKFLFLFSLIHFDVQGPSCVANTFGSRWFKTLIDDCTQITWLYLMKSKYEVTSIFPTFHKFISTQFGATIHTIRSNNGKEYLNQDLITYLQKAGIRYHSSR